MNTDNCAHSIADDQLIANIEQFGWTVMLIESTSYLPAFAYTVGLHKNYNHPELICFGLTTKTMHAILNIGGELVKAGQILGTGIIHDDFFEQGKAQLLHVDMRNLTDYFGYAIWFNRSTNFPALQLVWTDRNGFFPWEDGFAEGLLNKQPLLDRNADFKFREARNLGIFTTRQWIEDKKPILRVIHDDEGDWQFLTGDQMPDDIRIVALEQMTLRDASLNDIFNLDYGEQATREFVGDKWARAVYENEE